MRNKIRNKYKKGNDIFNLKEEEKNEIKTHPKKSIILFIFNYLITNYYLIIRSFLPFKNKNGFKK